MISTIKGGEWIYQVPLKCEMKGFITFPPDENIKDVASMIEYYVKKTSESDPWLKDNPPEVEGIQRFRGAMIDPGQPIVNIAKDCISRILGTEPQIAVQPAASDVRIPIIYGKIPTIIVGPRGVGAHSPNEWVDVDSYLQLIKITALTIMKWCEYEKER